MLNEDDRALVRRTFMEGPAALMEVGYTTFEQIEKFLTRPDVREEMDLLEAEFKHSDGLKARTRFIANRQLSRLSGGAVATLGRALAGPVYARDKEGNIILDAVGRPVLRHAEPTFIQFKAAGVILDMLGVSGDDSVDRGAEASVSVLFKRGQNVKVTVEMDRGLATEEQRALSRERIRNAIEHLAKRLPEARQKAEARLLPPEKKKRGKKKGQIVQLPPQGEVRAEEKGQGQAATDTKAEEHR